MAVEVPVKNLAIRGHKPGSKENRTLLTQPNEAEVRVLAEHQDEAAIIFGLYKGKKIGLK